MRGAWLKRSGSSTCLLLVTGWGMGPEPFAPLNLAGRDCFCCFDHASLEPPDLEQFARYERLELLAWSMGIWVAARIFSEMAFDRAVALAGSLSPVHPEQGIAPKAFDRQLAHLEKGGDMHPFYAAMFDRDDTTGLSRFLAHRPRRSLGSLLRELRFLRSVAATPARDIYSERVITLRDRVFPARSQVRAWGRGRCTRRPWPHFPFYIPDVLETLFDGV